jgi:D-inositol-3-phosphate glycosyltransferase
MDKLQARQQLGITVRDACATRDFTHNLESDSDKIILFVGRIERLKGIDKVIRALPYLKYIKPRLFIVGEDGNRRGEINNLKKLAQELGVAGSVNFSGLVDYESLPVYYNAADVCVFPSYYESFGLVPLESLACGIPVVATNVGDCKILSVRRNWIRSMDNEPNILPAN